MQSLKEMDIAGAEAAYREALRNLLIDTHEKIMADPARKPEDGPQLAYTKAVYRRIQELQAGEQKAA